jgi:Arc/MetJ family transcription regulator
MPAREVPMRTTIEVDDKLFKRALAVTKAKTKKELIHRSLEEVIRQERIHRLLGKLGRFPLRITPRTLARLRADA